MTLIDLPNWHPVAVHLPIVLLPLALVFALIAVWRAGTPSGHPYERAATWLVGAAFVSALVTWQLGRSAAAGLPPLGAGTERLLGEHADLALWTLVIAGVATILHGAGSWLVPGRAGRGVRLAACFGLVAASLLVAATAEHGGRLVYRHAVAVRCPGEPPPGAGEDAAAAPETPVGDAESQGGAWWRAMRLVIDHGTARLEPAGDGRVRLVVDGRARLLSSEPFGDVSLAADVDLASFAGIVGLLHHVTGGHEESLELEVPGGTIRLVEAEQELRRVLDEAAVTAQGSVRLRVSAAGRHLKGFVDDALVVHGHRPAGAPGLVGLLVDGRGRVVLPAPFAIDGDANSVDPEHAAGAQSPHDHGAHAH